MNQFCFSILCFCKIQSFIRILEAASGLCTCLHASHPRSVDRILKTEVAQSNTVCVLDKLLTTFLPTLMVSSAAASMCLRRFGKGGSVCQVTHERSHTFASPRECSPQT